MLIYKIYALTNIFASTKENFINTKCSRAFQITNSHKKEVGSQWEF